MRSQLSRLRTAAVLLLIAALAGISAYAQSENSNKPKPGTANEVSTRLNRISTAVARARFRGVGHHEGHSVKHPNFKHPIETLGDGAQIDDGEGICFPSDDYDCAQGGDGEGPDGGQAELAIAVDPTGMHIVVGYNDTRGFSLSPASVSGFAYSDDGGLNFTDGGQLPTATVGHTPDGATYPQVFGDADIKYVPGGGGCQFIYSS